MGRELHYTSMDRIISKIYRDLGIEDISETDLVEWTGEALENIALPGVYDSAINVLDIKDHQADLPFGLVSIIQVARDNDFGVKEETFSECKECNEKININKFEKYLHNLFSLNKKFNRDRFTPVRLSNHTFFNSLVCEEKLDIYSTCKDEYTISNGKIRTSFKEGIVLLSYYKILTDEETGYPMIPDDISIITAITYYIMWKYNQKMWFMGREGYGDKMKYSMELWNKYCGQAKTNQIMPSGVDQYQNFTEEKFNWIKSFKYNNFFKNLGRGDLKIR